MSTFTHYFIQAENVGGFPQRVHHTYNIKTGEYFYKFVDHKEAQELLEAEKKASPNTRFRMVKHTEKFDSGKWI